MLLPQGRSLRACVLLAHPYLCVQVQGSVRPQTLRSQDVVVDCLRRLHPVPGDNVAQRKESFGVAQTGSDSCAPGQALSSLSFSFLFQVTGVITATAESCQKMKAASIMQDTQ